MHLPTGNRTNQIENKIERYKIMAKITSPGNGKMRVQYDAFTEYLRRHITPALIAQIDRLQSKTFVDDPEKAEIYAYIADFVADRCCPVLHRDDIAEIISQFEIIGSEEEAEEEDYWQLTSGRLLA